MAFILPDAVFFIANNNVFIMKKAMPVWKEAPLISICNLFTSNY